MIFDVVESLHSWILHSIAADMIEIRKENMRVITDVKVYLMNIRVRQRNINQGFAICICNKAKRKEPTLI